VIGDLPFGDLQSENLHEVSGYLCSTDMNSGVFLQVFKSLDEFEWFPLE